MCPDQSKHAESLSGVFPEQPPSPPAEGKPTLQEGPNVLAARAVLAGEQMPECYWSPWPAKGEPAARLQELAAEVPAFTAESLGARFPDKRAVWPEDRADIAAYNALSPLERALDEVFADFAEGIDETEVRNPIYLHELRQAQRRTLERLLEVAEQPSQASTPRRLSGFYGGSILNLRSSVDELESCLRSKDFPSATQAAMYISSVSREIVAKAKSEVACA